MSRFVRLLGYIDDISTISIATIGAAINAAM